MKKNFVLCILVCLTAATVFAQKNNGTYNWGIGGKYVPSKFTELEPLAVSIKKYTKAGDALELLLTNHKDGYRGTLLFELSPALDPNKKSVRLVIGPGVHVGYQRNFAMERHDKNPTVGIDGIVGLEWKLPGLPIALQADYQPSADLVGNNEIFTDWAGATLRITF
jgi:hypothetical protein